MGVGVLAMICSLYNRFCHPEMEIHPQKTAYDCQSMKCGQLFLLCYARSPVRTWDAFVNVQLNLYSRCPSECSANWGPPHRQQDAV